MKLRMKVIDRQDMFGAGLQRRIKALEDAEFQARAQGARVATQRTRSNFRYRRDAIAVRPGRSSTGGKMRQHLEWTARNGRVEFHMAEANARVPHWIIQEIGTGQRATVRDADRPNPVGRPRKGATYVKSVRSQKGRKISAGLVWATGGNYSPAGSSRTEQLHPVSRVSGAPSRRSRRTRMEIKKEIRGQNFVQKGGHQGFRVYERSVLAAARQAFRKSARP